jgi:hypothetical protein
MSGASWQLPQVALHDEGPWNVHCSACLFAENLTCRCQRRYAVATFQRETQTRVSEPELTGSFHQDFCSMVASMASPIWNFSRARSASPAPRISRSSLF